MPYPSVEAKDWGPVHGTCPVLNILMDGDPDTTCYEPDQVLGASHYRFDISIGISPKRSRINENFGDASPDYIQRLEWKAAALAAAMAKLLQKVINKLEKPIWASPR